MKAEFTVVVVDDHPLLREGVVHILESHGMKVVAQGATAEEAVTLCRQHVPNILVLDINLPGGGLSAIEAIASSGIATSTLAFSMVDDEECVKQAFRLGARGYMLKGMGCKEMVEAVRTVARGEIYVSARFVTLLMGRLPGALDHVSEPEIEFTEREEQVIHLLGRGLSNKEIAF